MLNKRPYLFHSSSDSSNARKSRLYRSDNYGRVVDLVNELELRTLSWMIMTTAWPTVIAKGISKAKKKGFKRVDRKSHVAICKCIMSLKFKIRWQLENVPNPNINIVSISSEFHWDGSLLANFRNVIPMSHYKDFGLSILLNNDIDRYYSQFKIRIMINIFLEIRWPWVRNVHQLTKRHKKTMKNVRKFSLLQIQYS